MMTRSSGPMPLRTTRKFPFRGPVRGPHNHGTRLVDEVYDLARGVGDDRGVRYHMARYGWEPESCICPNAGFDEVVGLGTDARAGRFRHGVDCTVDKIEATGMKVARFVLELIRTGVPFDAPEPWRWYLRSSASEPLKAK